MDCKEAQLQAHWQSSADANDEQTLQEHVDTCTGCQETLETLQQLDHMFESGPLSTLDAGLEPLPLVEASWSALQARLEQRSVVPTVLPWWEQVNRWIERSMWWFAPAVVALFVLVPWATQPPSIGLHTTQTQAPSVKTVLSSPPTLPTVPKWIAKGAPVLDMFYARPAARPQQHSTPQRARRKQVTLLHPGDFVQFQYKVPYNACVLIVGLTRTGTLFVYTPFQGRTSQAIKAGPGKLPAAGALELDDELGEESFFVFVSKQKFTLKQLQARLGPKFRALQTSLQRTNRSTLRVDQWWIRSFKVHKQVRRKVLPRP